uniref:Osteocalcin n=1 Tax=Accipiter nisus TaxID=211598 RepID=A0A8B9NCL1_9AVES
MTRPALKVSVCGWIHPCCPRDGGTQPSLTPYYVPTAFVSRRASAEVVRRHKRNYIYDSSVYGAVRDPLEAKREVCEFNPNCDELADHIGFQEAYRRFYGPV